MAFASPNEVFQELPNKGGGITDAKMQTFIDEAVDVVTAGVSASPETGLGKRAVRADARAQALTFMRIMGDNIRPDLIEDAREVAAKYASEYQASTATTVDDVGFHQRGIVMGTPW